MRWNQVGLLFVLAALPGLSAWAAVRDCEPEYLQVWAEIVAMSFETNQWETVMPTSGRGVRLTVEHAIDGDDETAHLMTPLAVTEWLDRYSPNEGWPQRARWPLLSCSGGRCEFGGDGLSHNHLFLNRAHYHCDRGRLRLTAIYLIGGD